LALAVGHDDDGREMPPAVQQRLHRGKRPRAAGVEIRSPARMRVQRAW
jgi:hypothetical protein